MWHVLAVNVDHGHHEEVHAVVRVKNTSRILGKRKNAAVAATSAAHVVRALAAVAAGGPGVVLTRPVLVGPAAPLCTGPAPPPFLSISAA